MNHKPHNEPYPESLPPSLQLDAVESGYLETEQGTPVERVAAGFMKYVEEALIEADEPEADYSHFIRDPSTSRDLTEPDELIFSVADEYNGTHSGCRKYELYAVNEQEVNHRFTLLMFYDEMPEVDSFNDSEDVVTKFSLYYELDHTDVVGFNFPDDTINTQSLDRFQRTLDKFKAMQNDFVLAPSE